MTYRTLKRIYDAIDARLNGGPTYENLSATQCKWPHGNGRFCGADIAEESLLFCAHHRFKSHAELHKNWQAHRRSTDGSS